MNEYASLSQLRTYLSLASAETADDTELRNILLRSSRQIDRYTRRHFYPRRFGGTNTLKYDLPPTRDTLRFDKDILEVKGLSDLNGASEIDTSVYWLKAGDNWNQTPYDRIVIDDSSGSLFNFSGTDQRAVHVDAIEGYHEDYGNAWVNSGASLTGALAASVTLASVSGSGGANVFGVAPRFQENQIWKLGSGASAEHVYVQDTINTSSVRLVRAINGTSTTAQAASQTIFVWQPEYDIEQSVIELAGFAYHKAKSPFTNRISVLQLGVIEQPEAWPETVLDRLDKYKRNRVYTL